MIRVVFFLSLLSSLSVIAQNSFQLAPPQMNYSSTFFTNKAIVNLLFAQPGANIRYTTNGDEPKATDRIYTKPIIITKNLTTIKAKSFSTSFLPSATVSATFVKDGLSFNASFPSANSQYTGEGPNTLNNNKGGIPNYMLKHWLGYNEDSVTIYLTLNKEQTLKSVLLNMMQNQGGWILYPHKIEAFAFDNTKKSFIKIGDIDDYAQQNVEAIACKPFIIKLNNTLTNQLKLVLHNQKLPVWHSGKGNNSWIFIDEIKLY